MLLTRKQFRKKVFDRDNNYCVICGYSTQLVAHHIMERRLFDNGGYYTDNGATLCEKCHIKAEQTVLSCEEIREAAGIKKKILPPHLYNDICYDKWANIVLPDKRRVKGELFYDISVQRILKAGGILDLFCKYVKYPRTYHCPWSEGVTDDDRVIKNMGSFEEKIVVVSSKMDGENTTIYNDYIHARSLNGQHHPSQSWVRNLQYKVGYNIPDGWRVCGENLYAKHTIHYSDLDNYFMVFSIWDENNECLNWEDTIEWTKLLGLSLIPAFYIGEYDEDIIKNKFKEYEKEHLCEGYVIRPYESFKYIEFRKFVVKYVHQEFRKKVNQNGHNWRHKQIILNKLRNK